MQKEGSDVLRNRTKQGTPPLLSCCCPAQPTATRKTATEGKRRQETQSSSPLSANWFVHKYTSGPAVAPAPRRPALRPLPGPLQAERPTSPSLHPRCSPTQPVAPQEDFGNPAPSPRSPLCASLNHSIEMPLSAPLGPRAHRQAPSTWERLTLGTW